MLKLSGALIQCFTVMSVFLLATTLFRCEQSTQAIVMLMLANAATALLTPGSMKSIVLVGGPAYAGVIASISVLCAYMANIALPYLVAMIIKDETYEAWNHAYYLAAALSAGGGVLFFFIGSGDLQAWAKHNSPETQTMTTKK